MSEQKIKVENPQGVVLAMVAGLLLIRFVFDLENLVFDYTILGISVLSALFKSLAELIAIIWLSTGKVLGKINGAILLTIIYFLVLTPIALLKKAVSPHATFRSSDVKSKFQVRKHLYSSDDLKLPW